MSGDPGRNDEGARFVGAARAVDWTDRTPRGGREAT